MIVDVDIEGFQFKQTGTEDTIRNAKLLFVRARDQQQWYLPLPNECRPAGRSLNAELNCRWAQAEVRCLPRKSISAISHAAHANARAKGWYDGVEMTTTVVGEKAMLIVGEVAEFHEEARVTPVEDLGKVRYGEGGKPEGGGIELADVVIRAFDLAEALNIDIEEMIAIKMAYNRTRPYRHGGKRA